MKITLTARPVNKAWTHYVKGPQGYLMHRNGGVPSFYPFTAETKYLAPKFTLRQAVQLAKLCTDAGCPCDVSVV